MESQETSMRTIKRQGALDACLTSAKQQPQQGSEQYSAEVESPSKSGLGIGMRSKDSRTSLRTEAHK